MSKLAWLYIGAILVAAGVMSGMTLPKLPQALSAWPTFVVLVILATLSQLFHAQGPGNIAFFATPVFLFAGVLLLDPSLFVILAIIPRLIEWGKQRWIDRSSAHLGAWYIQPFNISNDLIDGLVAGLIFRIVSDASGALNQPGMLFAATSAVITFVALNHLVLGQVVVLARKISWRETGLLSAESVISDLILLCLGACVAMLWQFNPWFLPLALSPLGMMYQALRIPQLKREAETDAKTGLLNIRYFNRKFTEELDRAARFGRPLAVIMADLDFLRNINNTYGHLAGDVVITGIGKIIGKTIRDYDLAGRFGGEEFCVVLPEVTPIEAYAAADRIRRTIEAASFEVSTSPTPIRATMSIGVACYPADGTTLTDLTHEADVAVYQAKLQGRNRVVCAADVPHSIKIEHGTSGASQRAIPAPEVSEQQVAEVSTTGPALATPVVTSAVDSPAKAHGTREAAPGNTAVEKMLPAAAVVNHVTPAPDKLDDRTKATDTTAGKAQKAAAFLHLFVGAVILGGILLTGIGFSLDPRIDLVALAVLVILIVLTEFLQVSVYGKNAMSASLAAIYASALIGGLPLMSLVSAASALVDHVRQRRSLTSGYKTAFNWATHVIAGGLTGFAVSGRLLPSAYSTFVPLAILTIVGTFTYYVIETGLISTAINLSTGNRIREVWQAQFRWLVNHYLVLGTLGLFLSIAYAALGVVGIVVFALPVVMMRYVQQQYVERTEDSVRELQRMNRELAHANQEIVDASLSIQGLNSKLQHLNDELFWTLGKILDARDPYVGSHAAQVADYAAAIATELGLPPERVELVRQAGFLHDIGKIAIPEQILHKPAKLTDEEYELVKTHSAIGADLLETSQGLRHLVPFVRHHHERWDGRGYPDGIRGEAIPIEARILNVCDSVEAMASDRPYHRGLSIDEIVAEVRRCAGTQFDPTIADIFIRIVERERDAFVVNSALEVKRRTSAAKTRQSLNEEPSSQALAPMAA